MTAAFPRSGRAARVHDGVWRARDLRPASPLKMARRVDWAMAHHFAPMRAGSTAPALVVTGEADLDRVVPVDVDACDTSIDLPSATHVVLERTGHNGLADAARTSSPHALERFVEGARNCLREIAGPGRARSKRCSTCRTASRARRSVFAPPASARRAARCIQRRCTRRRRRWRASAARCCASISAASAAARERWTRARREGRLHGRRSIHGDAVSRAAAVGGGLFVRLVGRAETGAAEDARIGADRHRAAGAIGYDFSSAMTQRRKPKFIVHGEARRADSAQDRSASSTRSSRSRRSWSRSSAPTTCSTARTARSATRSRICWRISHGRTQ